MQERWNAFASFFDRFRLTGWKRLFNEALGEALTMGAGGLIVLFILAVEHEVPDRERAQVVQDFWKKAR